LLILLNVSLTVSSWAQVNQINGTTKLKTKVTYGQDARTDMIPKGYAVDIIDANNYFFTIKYHDGNGYVNRNHIKYDPAQLKELMKIKNGMADLNEVPINSTKGDDKYKYEIDHIRYCAGKYSREIKTGYVFSLAGVAAVASPSFIDITNQDTEKIVKRVGYGMGILGVLLIIDSNKWMKRMYIGPEGFGIRYSF
jgi:hypothetical protein